MPCEICGKLVKNKYTLKQHVKLVHEKKKGKNKIENVFRKLFELRSKKSIYSSLLQLVTTTFLSCIEETE